MKTKMTVALLASLCLAGAARAQSADAKRFGARQSVQSVSISPDGKRIAILAPTRTRGTALLVLKPDGSGMVPILASSGDPDRLTSCGWSTSNRLVCNIFMVADRGSNLVGITRMIALDADGTHVKELSSRQSFSQLYEAFYGGGVLDWLPDNDGSAILMTREFVPEQSTGTLVANTQEGLGVERVDTVSLKRTTVEAAKSAAVEFITDGHGTTRIMGVQPRTGTGYGARKIVYTYRKPGSRDWQPLSTVEMNGYLRRGFDPYAVDRDLNVAYGFDNVNGRTALFRVALDGSMKREMVFARDDVDIDSLVQIGRQQRVVGVSFATDQRRTSFFDPELNALSASLSKALPGLPLVSFSDASLDEKKLVLFAGSDNDPGRYFLLDRDTRKMAEISPVRPDLTGAKLASVRSITFKAADGTSIPGYLTLPVGSDGKKLPAIVMPHGGPTSRDEWGFDWLAQFFAARGYAVLQPNFRGSSGYGERWFRQNGFKSWRTAIGDVNDGGRWLVSEGIAMPGKLAILGWSYGGYAALQSSVLDSDLFKAIVAIAPVTDLERQREKMKEYIGTAAANDFIDEGALLKEGSPAQNAGRIKAPVLLFHGDRDLNVAVEQSRLMASKLREAGDRVELVEFKGLDHQLDDSAVRAAMLDKIDGFLRTTLAIQP